MQPYNPHQNNAVQAAITAPLSDATVTREERDEIDRLLGHIREIAHELADRDAFEFVDGGWVLPDREWDDFMRRGDGNKYR
jgi:hypothetical protein